MDFIVFFLLCVFDVRIRCRLPHLGGKIIFFLFVIFFARFSRRNAKSRPSNADDRLFSYSIVRQVAVTSPGPGSLSGFKHPGNALRLAQEACSAAA